MVATLIKVYPMVQRTYQDRQGLQQQFASKGFLFSLGNGTFYAEAIQETARAYEQTPPDVNKTYSFTPTFRAREYEVNGEKRVSLESTISGLLRIL